MQQASIRHSFLSLIPLFLFWPFLSHSLPSFESIFFRNVFEIYPFIHRTFLDLTDLLLEGKWCSGGNVSKVEAFWGELVREFLFQSAFCCFLSSVFSPFSSLLSLYATLSVRLTKVMEGMHESYRSMSKSIQKILTVFRVRLPVQFFFVFFSYSWIQYEKLCASFRKLSEFYVSISGNPDKHSSLSLSLFSFSLSLYLSISHSHFDSPQRFIAHSQRSYFKMSRILFIDCWRRRWQTQERPRKSIQTQREVNLKLWGGIERESLMYPLKIITDFSSDFFSLISFSLFLSLSISCGATALLQIRSIKSGIFVGPNIVSTECWETPKAHLLLLLYS